MGARYLAAFLVAAVLAVGFAASAWQRGGGVAEDYVRSMLVMDFQRSAMVGFAAAQPTYALENLAMDIARLYMNIIILQPRPGVYTVAGSVAGYAPAAVEAGGAGLRLAPGNILMLCSGRGNRLVTGKVGYNATVRFRVWDGNVEVLRLLAQPTMIMNATTTYHRSGELLSVRTEMKLFLPHNVTSVRATSSLFDLERRRLLEASIISLVSTEGRTDKAIVSVESKGPLALISYTVTGGGEEVSNTTIVPSSYVRAVEAATAQLWRMVSVDVSEAGTSGGLHLCNVEIRVDGEVSFAGAKLKVSARMGGKYADIGGILYPLDTRLESYEAILSGFGKSCRIILGGPANLAANVTAASS